ncbi:unnamed protein product [Albugo candida]|uniref:Uncharacterized protein n=1 Tax=Albugo candida TaxID=65357 RepID=A0A024FWN3_9STRA|nr:unnamed protein product [Albugo candida]|eukprot:CCI11054.1 unnamed protein product [Albugo candida]
MSSWLKLFKKINKLYFSCPYDQRHTKVRMLFIPVDLAVLGSHPVDPESGELSYGSFRVPAHHTITIQVRNSVKRQFSAYLLIVAILGRYLQKSNRTELEKLSNGFKRRHIEYGQKLQNIQTLRV